MPNAGFQSGPEIVWFGDYENAIIQHRINSDTIARVLLPSEHLLLRNSHINTIAFDPFPYKKQASLARGAYVVGTP
jgi:hypothetical protein